jgi:hypothetical protein
MRHRSRCDEARDYAADDRDADGVLDMPRDS